MKFSPKVRIRTLAAALVWAALNCGLVESQESIILKDIVAVYDVAIKRTNVLEEDMKYIWSGVILNKNYVLSAEVFKDKEEFAAKDLRIYVGYANLGRLNETIRVNDNLGTYEVAHFWTLEILLLLKTKNEIELNKNIRSISLPQGNFAREIKNPFAIPQNKEFTTSFWCRSIYTKNYRLKEAKIIRKCKKGTCFRDDGTFPGCTEFKVDKSVCILPPGAPLVYNNILVGLRKERKKVKSDEKVINGDYINAAYYEEAIRTVMIDVGGGDLDLPTVP